MTPVGTNESAAKKVPIAMMLLVVGLMLVVVGVLWPRIPVLAALNSPISNDFLRGFLFGFGIVLEMAGLVIITRAAVGKRKEQ
jgi:hypothetical protein